MEKAIYFTLILYGILSQGICLVSEGKNESSSNLLIRQKRVVGGVVRRLSSCVFLVNVLQNGRDHCPATLLTSNIAISSATCFINQNTRNMRILSYSEIGGKKLHEIVGVIFLDPHFNPVHPTVRNLALVRFAPSIIIQPDNRPVTIYSGNLTTDHSTSRVISWGTPYEVGGRRITADHFQTFSVVLISIEYCQHVYPNVIGNGHLCAVGLHAGEYCDTDTDTGIPLMKGNQLLGIFVYRCHSRLTSPNVFMNLLDHDIRRWIHQHVPTLNLF